MRALLAELEVVATSAGDLVVEHGAVGHEVAEADTLAPAVVDLHVLHHDTVHGGKEVVSVVKLQRTVLAVACCQERRTTVVAVS